MSRRRTSSIPMTRTPCRFANSVSSGSKLSDKTDVISRDRTAIAGKAHQFRRAISKQRGNRHSIYGTARRCRWHVHVQMGIDPDQSERAEASQSIRRAPPGADRARMIAANYNKPFAAWRHAAGGPGQPAAGSCDNLERRTALHVEISGCRPPGKLCAPSASTACPILPEYSRSIFAARIKCAGSARNWNRRYCRHSVIIAAAHISCGSDQVKFACY